MEPVASSRRVASFSDTQDTLKAPVRKVLWQENRTDIPYTPVCG
jgi:hypothetical protein